MGMFTVYCVISGCMPGIARNILDLYGDDDDIDEDSDYGPVVISALRALADQHELSSQNDLCVIGAIHPSGQPYIEDFTEPPVSDLNPDEDIRVLPHCVMGDSWDVGFLAAPPPINLKQDWSYNVAYGCNLMVQTYALDILALATHGRMTPLRLWRLAMQQGYEEVSHPYCLEGVDYGAIAGQCEQQFPDDLPGFETTQLMELEKNGDIEVLKQRLVDDGLFWLWMAPDRANTPCGSRSAIESLPPDVLMHIVSSLLPESVLILANASRKDDESESSTTVPQAYPASQWPAQTPMRTGFPVGLDWEYIRRCVRSGSMRNRKRIWHVVLDIERVADRAGL
ncbi:hypothetical protein OG21DRAFT_1517457 [Imleria badia]|nr:hypothetical protein OG21DRAFT_1517457 [Imleria badia]